MRSTVSLLSLLVFASVGLAQFDGPGFGNAPRATSFEELASYSASIEPKEAKRGQLVTFKLTVTMKTPDAWTYPSNPPESQFSKNTIVLPKDAKPLVFVEPVKDPEGAKTKPDGTLYYPKGATWEFTAIVDPDAKPGEATISLEGTQLQACTEENCFNSRLGKPPTATFTVLEESVSVDEKYSDLVKKEPKTPEKTEPATSMARPEYTGVGTKKKALPTDVYKEKLNAIDLQKSDKSAASDVTTATDSSLVTLLLTAAFWGFVSLLTPCVFPMIPITVSLFLKQGEQSKSQVLKLAAIYSLTIVVVLGASAVFLLSLFRELSIDPYMNIFLGGLFLFFALSFFGLYEIALPNFMLRYTSQKRKAGGTIGTVFGALAFSIVSFTCVAPFLGGFAGLTASGNFNQLELVLAGIVFAVAFALPFFLLALFPSMLKQLPKSGGWLDSVKVVMGFLEFAAAFKFFRTAELRLLPTPEYFTYDLVITAWVAIALTAGLYLLNIFRLPHDEEKPHTGTISMVLGIGFLTLAAYLLPAAFHKADGERQRPDGVVYAWIDAFLLPVPKESKSSTDLPGTIERVRDLPADDTHRYIFLDFTGETCTNCRYNENDVFTLPKIEELMKQYTMVEMYTDQVPAYAYADPPTLDVRRLEADANLTFQLDAFGTQQLPLYAILKPEPNGTLTIVDVYGEGKINNVDAFAEFLQGPLK